MAATRETLLNMAIGKTSGGRNNAGAWLAQQLRDNRFAESDAEAIMREYASCVGGSGTSQYTAREALGTLKWAYNKAPREPWGTGKDNNGDKMTGRQYRIKAALQKLKGHSPAPPAEADVGSIQRFTKIFKNCRKIVDTPAVAYLESRGIPEELARNTGTYYCAVYPFLKKNIKDPKKPLWVKAPAVVFAIRKEENNSCKTIAVNGRRLEEWEGKNKITYGPKLQGVFATEGALNADPVAITEAPFDALSLALAGLPAIALCGTSGIPPWAITRLIRRGTPGRSRTIYLAFDADEAGDAAAGKIGGMLPLAKTTRLRPVGYKDWNAMLMGIGADSFREYVNTIIAVEPAKNPVIYPTPHNPQAGPCSDTDSTPYTYPGITDPEPAVDITPQQTPEETATAVSILADSIRTALVDRQLPIRIRQGEVITGIDLFAYSHAHSIVTGSPAIAGPARERLEMLGVPALEAKTN